MPKRWLSCGCQDRKVSLPIEYSEDMLFKTDMPVRPQQDAIAKWKGWVTANEGQFQAGAWYLGGKADCELST